MERTLSMLDALLAAPPRSPRAPKSPEPKKDLPLRTRVYSNEQIRDTHYEAAARLFSKNYGLWGPLAAQKLGRSSLVHGARIRITSRRLKKAIAVRNPSVGKTLYVSISDDDMLRGYAFATFWVPMGMSQPALWITQLVVHRRYRNQGIATKLLMALKQEIKEKYQWVLRRVGILASHPYALCAVLRAFGGGLEEAEDDLWVTLSEWESIMKSCPVEYVRKAKVHGDLGKVMKGDEYEDGIICITDTNIWADHYHVKKARKAIKSGGKVWPFGDLPGGSEYVLIVRTR